MKINYIQVTVEPRMTGNRDGIIRLEMRVDGRKYRQEWCEPMSDLQSNYDHYLHVLAAGLKMAIEEDAESLKEAFSKKEVQV